MRNAGGVVLGFFAAGVRNAAQSKPSPGRTSTSRDGGVTGANYAEFPREVELPVRPLSPLLAVRTADALAVVAPAPSGVAATALAAPADAPAGVAAPVAGSQQPVVAAIAPAMLGAAIGARGLRVEQ